MASLQKHRVKGRTYWRIVESRRVNGKPRAIPVMYLGSADDLLSKMQQIQDGQLRIQSFQHGDVAALKAVADRLGVEAIIERHVHKNARRLAVSTTLLLAAINRAVQPRSKRGWSSWAKLTSLHRLFPGLEVEQLSSQFFWDQMDCVEVDALQRIEEDLTHVVVEQLGIRLDTLFYDATNFFTYIASTNSRPRLPQRGHSKQKRSDLRIFSLALLVSREGQIPLCSHLYEGNRVDVKSFPDALTRIRERLQRISMDVQDVTLVYDKGNLSKENQRLVDEAPFSYVASLVPAHHSELMAIPVQDYQPLSGSVLGEVPVRRLTRTIWGQQRTVLLFLSEQLRQGQLRGLQQHLEKAIGKLEAWKQQLAKPRSGPRSTEAAHKQIESILAAQHLKKLLRVTYHRRRRGSNRLEYHIDDEARSHLEQEVFGKRILITDRADWSDEQILLAYRGQSEVEASFRQIKDSEHLALRPQYHWTDQKIHVHTFCCLLGLLLARVLEWEARKLGHTQGLSGLLDLLGTIRLAMVLNSQKHRAGRPRCEWMLEEARPEALRLFRHLVPDEAPFVYT